MVPRKQPHDSKYCGAKTRKGTPCRRPAGWGTSHPGTGRCKLHGGASNGPGPGNKNAVKHGIYETIIRDRLSPDEQAVFDAVPDNEDLRQELRILRFKLLRLLEPVEREMVIGTPEGAEKLTIQVDEVTKAYAIEKLVDGIRKIVKDMASTDDDTGTLVQLAEAIRRSAQELGEEE